MQGERDGLEQVKGLQLFSKGLVRLVGFLWILVKQNPVLSLFFP